MVFNQRRYLLCKLHRSTRQVVEFAMRLLTQDEQRDEPAPLTVKDGPPVEFFQFSDMEPV